MHAINRGSIQNAAGSLGQRGARNAPGMAGSPDGMQPGESEIAGVIRAQRATARMVVVKYELPVGVRHRRQKPVRHAGALAIAGRAVFDNGAVIVDRKQVLMAGAPAVIENALDRRIAERDVAIERGRARRPQAPISAGNSRIGSLVLASGIRCCGAVASDFDGRLLALWLRAECFDQAAMLGSRLFELRCAGPRAELIFERRRLLLDVGHALLVHRRNVGEAADRVGDAHRRSGRVHVGRILDVHVIITGAGQGDIELAGMQVLDRYVETGIGADFAPAFLLDKLTSDRRNDGRAEILGLVEGLSLHHTGKRCLVGRRGACCVGFHVGLALAQHLGLVSERAGARLDTVLLAIVLNRLAFELPKATARFHLFQDERIARRCRFHLGRVRRLAGDILDFARFQIALADLLDEPGLSLDRLPRPRIERVLGGIAQYLDLEAIRIFGIELVALPDAAPVALLKVGRPPRRIDVMQRDEAVLDVGTGAHLRRRAEQEPDPSGPDLSE
ncbi:unknown [Sinorhizobium phage PBC5]|nr:unknown [Sinorhizobium phage PBC5]